MCRNDDSDMKIVGAIAEPEEESMDETAALLKQETENGNLDRARELAKMLIDSAKQADIDHKIQNERLRMQRWLVLLFAADVEIDHLLPNTMVANTASSSFYSLLQTEAVDVYNMVEQNGSLSFYYLCNENGVINREKASKTFASLCGFGDSKLVSRIGKIFVDECIDKISKIVTELEFVK